MAGRPTNIRWLFIQRGAWPTRHRYPLGMGVFMRASTAPGASTYGVEMDIRWNEGFSQSSEPLYYNVGGDWGCCPWKVSWIPRSTWIEMTRFGLNFGVLYIERSPPDGAVHACPKGGPVGTYAYYFCMGFSASDWVEHCCPYFLVSPWKLHCGVMYFGD
jgi:hypothetical protein